MRAWQIYIIGVLVVSFPIILILNGLGQESGKGLGYDMEAAVTTTAIIGGLITGIYYLVKSKKKKTPQTYNSKTAI